MARLTDQQIRDAGILYLPLQQYLKDPFKLPEEKAEETAALPVNLTSSNVGSGGGGISAFDELAPTFLNERRTIDFSSDPTAQLTGRGRLDPMGSGFYDTLNRLEASNPSRGYTMSTFNENFSPSGEVIKDTSIDFNPDTNPNIKKAFFESVYEEPQKPSLINQGIAAVTDFFSGLGTPKVRGTLGTRLANQKMLPIPLPSMITAQARNPLMAGAANFNPALEGQLNYLEGQDGYIGRDPNSGGLKYGPESVLSGQNVISGFGTNDYVKQLDKYINKMIERGTVDDEFAEENLSKFQLEKLKKARIEKQNFLDSAIYKTQQEEIRKQQEARRQEVQNLQNRIDRGDFDSTSGIPDRDRSTVTAASAAKTSKVGGGGYTASDSKRDAARGRYDDGGRVYLYNRLK